MQGVGSDGTWQDVATPAALETYPFVGELRGRKRAILAADFASERLAYADGLALFDDTARPSEVLDTHRQEAFRQARERAVEAVDPLDDDEDIVLDFG